MTSINFNRTTIVQVAYVVKNIEKTAEQWAKALNVGPCFIWDIPLVSGMYRGQETDIDMTLGFCFSGGMAFEFIQQNNDAPSVYKELLDSKGEGFHHWGIVSEDFDMEIKDYQRRGHELAFAGTVPNLTRFAYMDTVAQLGGFSELIEDTPAMNEFFGGLVEQSENWDGVEDLIKVKSPGF